MEATKCAVLLAIFILITNAEANIPKCPMAQNEQQPCDGTSSSGAVINLCGICVSGSTRRPPDTDIDTCGICKGGNRCVGCDGHPGSELKQDGCGHCLPTDDINFNNCTYILTVWPPVVDLLLDRDVKLQLIGAGLSHSVLPDISCSVSSNVNDQVKLPVVLQEVEEDVIELEVDARVAAPGLYSIKCESNGIPGNLVNGSAELLVADSSSLGIEKVEPTTVKIGESFKMVMTLSSSPLSSVFCFASEPGRPQPHIFFADIDGLVVTCGSFVAWRATILTVGLAYTVDAAEEIPGKTAVITVESPAPQLVEASLSSDIRQLRVTFDQNIEGPESCSDILTPQNLNEIGNDARCNFIANNLIISLGEEAKLEEILELQLMEDAVRSAKADPPHLAQTAKGKITVQPEKALVPKYRMSAPPVVHANSSAEIRLSSAAGQRLSYQWSVDFDKEAASRRFKTQSQRLQLWESVRAVQRTLNKASRRRTSRSASSASLSVPLNVSAMVQDVDYIVKVTGKNAAGVEGPEITHTLRMTSGSASKLSQEVTPSLYLSAPLMSYADTELLVEAEVAPNAESVQQYHWLVQDMNGNSVDVPPADGPILRVPPATLRGGYTYNVTCTTVINMETLKGILQVEITHRGLKAVITETEIVIGTGHELQLDASLSYDPDNNPGKIEVIWCCLSLRDGSSCLLAGHHDRFIEKEYAAAMSQPVLQLPKGTLAVGEYKMTANVYKVGQEGFDSAEVTVLVVPGHPPEVRILSQSTYHAVNPLDVVTISGIVKGAEQGCLLWWEAISSPGFQPFDLSAELKLGDILTLEPEDTTSTEREIQLGIPGPVGTWPGLKGDTKYCLRLSASCGNSSSHADTVIVTNSPPNIQPLQVKPMQGEAFRTKFLLQTSEAEDVDQPLSYSFGYISKGSPSLPTTSNEKFEAYLLLPPGSDIQPLVRVCDSYQLCAERIGDAVHSEPPDSLSSTEVLEVSGLFLSLLQSGQFEAALAVVEPMLSLLKQQSPTDESKGLNQGTAEVSAAVKKELNIRKSNMDNSHESIQANLDFLDVSVQIVQLLPRHGEQQSLLKDVLEFRDMIDSMDTSGAKEKLRRKREAKHDSQPLNNELRKYMTFMQLTSYSIRSLEDENEALKNMDQLLIYIHKSIHAMCSDLKTGSNLQINMELLNVSAQLVVAGDLSTTSFTVPLGAPPQILAKLQFSGGITVGSDKDSLCLGSASFQDDYLTSLAQKKRVPQYLSPLSNRISNVYEFTILNSKGTVLQNEQIKEPLILLLPVTKVAMQGKFLHCGLWRNNGWDLNTCQSDGVPRNQVLECHCTTLGNYSVFIADVPPKTTTRITESAAMTVRPVEHLTSSHTESSTGRMSTVVSTSSSSPTASTVTSTIKMTESVSDTTVLSTGKNTVSSANTRTPLEAVTTATATMSSSPVAKRTSGSDVTESSTSLYQVGTGSAEESTTEISSHLTTRLPGKVISNNTVYNVIFRIEEDFGKIVSKNEKQFENHLKIQILDQVHEMPSNMIYGIYLTNGSIVATLRLVDTDVQKVSVVLPTLVEMLRTGGLKINGTNGAPLSIPPQNITIIQQTMEPPEEQYAVVYAVSGTVVVTSAAVVTAIATAIFVRRRTEKKHMQMVQENNRSSAPTYRKFEFEQTLEGTAESLARYRTTAPVFGSSGTGLGTVISGVKYLEPAYLLEQLNGSTFDNGKKIVKLKQKSNDSQQLVEKEVKVVMRNGSVDHLPGTPTDD
ncbi:uncharacterized protein LOC124619798 [Schistocerca americana]|uniref:uncharacterized protein LOC124619798 n=1 Tax=Schistocerca americana TaxID=7009 RepID=UPI001F50146E|nr:uncharacterized protein LOC124619798 [Schistocerca americana]